MSDKDKIAEIRRLLEKRANDDVCLFAEHGETWEHLGLNRANHFRRQEEDKLDRLLCDEIKEIIAS